MLARWSNKGMLPSYELLTLMQAHQITPDMLEIHCGKYIRLGKKGPVIPIDEYGQTTTPSNQSPNDTPKSLDADTIITKKKSATNQTAIALIHARGKRTSETNAISSDRLEQTLAMTHAFPVPGESTHNRRLPHWAELIILLNIAAITFWLKDASRFSQHLGFALTAILTFPLLHAFMDITQHWMAVSAPIATIITAWLIPYSNRKIT